MDNIIEITGLNKSFGAVHAVRDLSFRVKKGELFAFLGVNRGRQIHDYFHYLRHLKAGFGENIGMRRKRLQYAKCA